MSKALVIIKSMGIGDLLILISSIHAISKKIDKPVTVLAQKNTRAFEILKHDPHIENIIELDEKEIKTFLVGAIAVQHRGSLHRGDQHRIRFSLRRSPEHCPR